MLGGAGGGGGGGGVFGFWGLLSFSKIGINGPPNSRIPL